MLVWLLQKATHWLCDRWAFVWNLRLTTDMTSSVTRRPVRTGGSCLLKRIVVLGDDPFVRLLLLLLFASARLWLTSDSSLWMAHTANTCVLCVEFNIETSRYKAASSSFISNWKEPRIARWMRTLCPELAPLSRPYCHCFVGVLASKTAREFEVCAGFICYAVVGALAKRGHVVQMQKEKTCIGLTSYSAAF